MNADRHRRGFTLIEVLVALAIVAFGLIAVFGQMSQTATAAFRLRDKTLASWVAHNKVTELRLSGEYPGVGTQSDDVEMANRRWHYEIKISKTEGDYLRRADVTVAFAEEPNRPLATVVGFLAQPSRNSAPGPAATGWPRITEEDLLTGALAPTPTPTPTPVPDPDPGNGDDGGATGNAQQ